MSDATTAIRLARQLATVLRRLHYHIDAGSMADLAKRIEAEAPPDPVTRNTPEQQRKISAMMAARCKQLRHMRRCFPRYTEGMPTKEYVRRYRMENLNAACFEPDDVYFLEVNE